MPTDAITTSLLRQLSGHRATLQTLLAQRAGLGILYAPPSVHNGIAQARAAIAQLKVDLRGHGVAVDDEPGDVAGPEDAMPTAGPGAGGQYAQGNQNVQVGGQGNTVIVSFGAAASAPATEEDDEAGEELLPPIAPSAELPDLFPVANDLIGRAEERTQLGAWYDALATDRRGRFVWITGRPGFGKRSLLNALIDDVRADGGLVLHARFWPISRASAEARAEVWDDDPLLDAEALALEPEVAKAWPRAAQLGGRGWVRFVAQLSRALGRVPTPKGEKLEDDPTSLRGLLRRAAPRTGLLLAFEGFDDADDQWIELLRDLAPEIERDLPIMVVATATLPKPLAELGDDDLSERLHLVKTLQAEGRAELVWLGELRLRDVVDYVGDIDAELARRLRSIGDGIPAIVESLWLAWQSEGVVTQDDAGVWHVADDARGWVFGDQREAALRVLRARLPEDAPLSRAQVEQLLGVAALEGPAFTVQAAARVLGHAPDTVLDLCDEYLLDTEERPGMLAEVGFVDVPGVVAARRPYLYRFAYAHLWHLWGKYGLAEAQRPQRQGQLAEALELVYHGATERLAARLAALFTAAGKPQRAEPYRQRGERAADLAVLLWQIGLLEGQERDRFADYRLYELRVTVSDKLYDAGRYGEGAAHAEAALQQAEEWNEQLRIAWAANFVGINLDNQGSFTAAQGHLEHALTIREQVLGPQHPHTATSLNNLAALFYDKGEYGTARPLYERALTIREQVLGPQHPHTAMSLNNLAMLFHSQGKYGAARPLFERALAINEQVLGPHHPLTASSLNSLAGFHKSQGEYGAALPLYKRALAIREQMLGPHHPLTASILNNLAGLLNSQGEYGAALPLYKRALAINEQVLGPDHPHTASSLRDLAVLLERQGQYAAARPLFERALAIREQVLGPHHPHTQNVRANLEAFRERMAREDRQSDPTTP